MVGVKVRLLLKAFQPVHFVASYMQSDSLENEAKSYLIKWTTEDHIMKG